MISDWVVDLSTNIQFIRATVRPGKRRTNIAQAGEATRNGLDGLGANGGLQMVSKMLDENANTS